MSEFVRLFYNGQVAREWARAETPLYRIEFASALRLIDTFFPATGAVCDVGGGPGRYSIELLRRGFHVTLVDLSEALLEFGQAEITRAGLQLDCALRADARELHALGSGHFDAALLMGPMYHVVEDADRMRVLVELRRILKSEGVAIITYLNSWGLLKTGISDFPDRFRDMHFLRSMVGEQTFRGNTLHNFTECYWSTPPVAIAEVEQAGFEVMTYASGEGFAGGLRPLIDSLAAERPEVYANVVNMAVETSQLPQYRDTGEHLQIVVRNR